MDQLRPTLADTVDYERLRTALTELRTRLPEVRHTEQSGDGLIEVTVDGRGDLLTLTLDPRTLRTPDATALARAITATIHHATAAVGDYVHHLTRTMLTGPAAP
jgi:DNA-binding protein YbaB